SGGCVMPFHNPDDTNAGGPHTHGDAVGDIDGGRMDGFVKTLEQSGNFDTHIPGCVLDGKAPNCDDVMGYKTRADIPNYWDYADNFVLQDHMFEPTDSWSLISHLYMLSGWSAACPQPTPSSCTTDLNYPESAWIPGASQYESVLGQLGAGP